MMFGMNKKIFSGDPSLIALELFGGFADPLI